LNNKKLLVRVDANSSIGSGHVMRCIAFAQQWQLLGGTVHFVMCLDAGELFKRVEKEGVYVHKTQQPASGINDIQTTLSIGKNIKADWIVLDGYHFTTQFQQEIKRANFKLIIIDDNSEHEHYYSDIVLNPNIYGVRHFYPYGKIEPYTQLLFGPQFVMLRKEFKNYAGRQKETITKRSNILITMGGGDHDNATLFVLKAINSLKCDDLNITLIIGPNNPNLESLRSYSQKMSSKLRLLYNVENMPALLDWAHLVISATGSSCYEFNFMRVPFINIIIAENQVNLAKKAHLLGGNSIGWHNNITIDKLKESILSILDNNQNPLPIIQFNNLACKQLMRIQDD